MPRLDIKANIEGLERGRRGDLIFLLTARVSINGVAIVLDSLRLVEGSHGLFLDFPSRQIRGTSNYRKLYEFPQPEVYKTVKKALETATNDYLKRKNIGERLGRSW